MQTGHNKNIKIVYRLLFLSFLNSQACGWVIVGSIASVMAATGHSAVTKQKRRRIHWWSTQSSSHTHHLLYILLITHNIKLQLVYAGHCNQHLSVLYDHENPMYHIHCFISVLDCRDKPRWLKRYITNPSDHFFSPWRRVAQLEVEVIIPQWTTDHHNLLTKYSQGSFDPARVLVYLFVCKHPR